VNHLTNPDQEISSLQPPEIYKEKASRENSQKNRFRILHISGEAGGF
jgi:hypothetical protein